MNCTYFMLSKYDSVEFLVSLLLEILSILDLGVRIHLSRRHRVWLGIRFTSIAPVGMQINDWSMN